MFVVEDILEKKVPHIAGCRTARSFLVAQLFSLAPRVAKSLALSGLLLFVFLGRSKTANRSILVRWEGHN